MVNLEKALVKDAKELLAVQKKCFENYSIKYGDFESNPYHMTLHRMEFNLKYKFGNYYKVVDFQTDKIIGGIFGFMLEEETTWHVAQFYIHPDFEHLGYGTTALQMFFDNHQNVSVWYADTIKQEVKNVEFYQKFGFKIIDEEEENEE